jgi:hypothetical protein
MPQTRDSTAELLEPEFYKPCDQYVVRSQSVSYVECALSFRWKEPLWGWRLTGHLTQDGTLVRDTSRERRVERGYSVGDDHKESLIVNLVHLSHFATASGG